jgi:hypothetical protein
MIWNTCNLTELFIFVKLLRFSVFVAANVNYRILVGRPEGRRPLGRHRRRGVDNIKMNLQEVGWEKWTGLIWLKGTAGRLL